MAYEYEEIIVKQHLSNFRSKTGKLIDTKESLELREVYAKAKAFDEILKVDNQATDEDRLTGEYESNIETIIGDYREDK